MGRLVRLDGLDTSRVVAFLESDPVANLGVLQRVQGPASTWGAAWGFEREGELSALCLVGGNILLAGQDLDAAVAFAEPCGRARLVGSIVGPEQSVAAFYEAVGQRWGRQWLRPRNIRYRQPLMLWSGNSSVDPETSVQRLDESVFDSYFEASVHMYTEEIGVSPLKHGAGYADAVRYRLRAGHAYGVVRGGRVLFKADLGIVYGRRAQIQGVWLDPALRGRGLSAPAMTAVVQQCRPQYPEISLYVNEFNEPAIRAYRRTGFVQVGTMATIHY